MNIGARIKELRKKRGINQTELAKAVNSSTTVISMIESNKGNPTVEVLNALSEYFDVSTDFILKGKEIEKNQNDISSTEQEIIQLVRKDSDIKATLLNLLDFKKKTINRMMMTANHELMAA